MKEVKEIQPKKHIIQEINNMNKLEEIDFEIENATEEFVELRKFHHFR